MINMRSRVEILSSLTGELIGKSCSATLRLRDFLKVIPHVVFLNYGTINTIIVIVQVWNWQEHTSQLDSFCSYCLHVQLRYLLLVLWREDAVCLSSQSRQKSPRIWTTNILTERTCFSKHLTTFGPCHRRMDKDILQSDSLWKVAKKPLL